MSIRAPRQWPTMIDEDLVANGSVPRAIHGWLVEQGLAYLLGHGWNHPGFATWDSAATQGWEFAAAQAEVFGVYLLPCARDLRLDLLVLPTHFGTGTSASNVELAVTCDAAGSTGFTLHWERAPEFDPLVNGVYLATMSWQSGTIRAVGDGSPDGGGLATITLTASQALTVFAIRARQLHNEVLEA